MQFQFGRLFQNIQRILHLQGIYNLSLFCDNILHSVHKKGHIHTVEPGYNRMGLCDSSCITSDILWYQLISYRLPQHNSPRL